MRNSNATILDEEANRVGKRVSRPCNHGNPLEEAPLTPRQTPNDNLPNGSCRALKGANAPPVRATHCCIPENSGHELGALDAAIQTA
jgi:hypothetical protein